MKNIIKYSLVTLLILVGVFFFYQYINQTMTQLAGQYSTMQKITGILVSTAKEFLILGTLAILCIELFCGTKINKASKIILIILVVTLFLLKITSLYGDSKLFANVLSKISGLKFEKVNIIRTKLLLTYISMIVLSITWIAIYFVSYIDSILLLKGRKIFNKLTYLTFGIGGILIYILNILVINILILKKPLSINLFQTKDLLLLVVLLGLILIVGKKTLGYLFIIFSGMIITTVQVTGTFISLNGDTEFSTKMIISIIIIIIAGVSIICSGIYKILTSKNLKLSKIKN